MTKALQFSVEFHMLWLPLEWNEHKNSIRHPQLMADFIKKQQQQLFSLSDISR